MKWCTGSNSLRLIKIVKMFKILGNKLICFLVTSYTGRQRLQCSEIIASRQLAYLNVITANKRKQLHWLCVEQTKSANQPLWSSLISTLSFMYLMCTLTKCKNGNLCMCACAFSFLINQFFLYHSFFSAQEINGKFNNFNFDIFYMCMWFWIRRVDDSGSH